MHLLFSRLESNYFASKMTEETHNRIIPDLFAVRLQKLEALRAAEDPFAANCEQSHTSADALASYKVQPMKTSRLFRWPGGFLSSAL